MKAIGASTRLRLAATAITLSLLVWSGCAVKWTPYYDETLDKNITTFQQDLEIYLSKLENLQAPTCTYPQNLDYYEQASAQLSVMQTRVQASPHNTQLLGILTALNKNLAELKKLQQDAGNNCLDSTVIEVERAGFERIFESLLAYELALKANEAPATAPTKH
jgi:hypothetical protein